jgi:hypothetical protein
MRIESVSEIKIFKKMNKGKKNVKKCESKEENTN